MKSHDTCRTVKKAIEMTTIIARAIGSYTLPIILLHDHNVDIPLVLQHLDADVLRATLGSQIHGGLSKAEVTQPDRVRGLLFRPYMCHADCLMRGRSHDPYCCDAPVLSQRPHHQTQENRYRQTTLSLSQS
jgi:hypothetical protein